MTPIPARVGPQRHMATRPLSIRAYGLHPAPTPLGVSRRLDMGIGSSLFLTTGASKYPSKLSATLSDVSMQPAAGMTPAQFMLLQSNRRYDAGSTLPISRKQPLEICQLPQMSRKVGPLSMHDAIALETTMT